VIFCHEAFDRSALFLGQNVGGRAAAQLLMLRPPVLDLAILAAVAIDLAFGAASEALVVQEILVTTAKATLEAAFEFILAVDRANHVMGS